MEIEMPRMDQSKKVVNINPHEGQFNYLGRWVNKEHFRAFVYNEQHEQKLADSYKEFESLIASGLWYAEKPSKEAKEVRKEILPKRKLKHDAALSNG